MEELADEDEASAEDTVWQEHAVRDKVRAAERTRPLAFSITQEQLRYVDLLLCIWRKTHHSRLML